jgi:hypothetical protein
MKTVINKHFSHFYDKAFVQSFLSSIILLAFALFVNFYASLYATKVASSSVTDIVLSNIRVYDVDQIFIFGPWVLFVFIFITSIGKTYRFPFIVKSIALFVLIRSFFITLTHIGPFPSAILVDSTRFISTFTAGGDLFFSAHTGLPFLMTLIFWKEKGMRYIMLATSLFFGTIVLMGHLHYTIDVVAAFFITYSIYALAETFFKKDMQYFHYGLKGDEVPGNF